MSHAYLRFPANAAKGRLVPTACIRDRVSDRGPWMGGWGDIVWAARFGTVSTIGDRSNELPHLVAQPPPPILTLPPFNERVTAALRAARRQRNYRSELVWMHYLRAIGISPHFWRFCNVARYRLGVDAAGSLQVSTVQLHMCGPG